MRSLKDRIELIVKEEECSRKEIDFREIKNFNREHKNHGGYVLEFEYSEENDLIQISVQCDAYNLEDPSYCLHQNQETPLEFEKTIVYENELYFDEISSSEIESHTKRKREIEANQRRALFYIVKNQ